MDEDKALQYKVEQVISLTSCSEDIAALTLHNFNHDIASSVDHILDTGGIKPETVNLKKGKSRKINSQLSYELVPSCDVNSISKVSMEPGFEGQTTSDKYNTATKGAFMTPNLELDHRSQENKKMKNNDGFSKHKKYKKLSDSQNDASNPDKFCIQSHSSSLEKIQLHQLSENPSEENVDNKSESLCCGAQKCQEAAIDVNAEKNCINIENTGDCCITSNLPIDFAKLPPAAHLDENLIPLNETSSNNDNDLNYWHWDSHNLLSSEDSDAKKNNIFPSTAQSQPPLPYEQFATIPIMLPRKCAEELYYNCRFADDDLLETLRNDTRIQLLGDGNLANTYHTSSATQSISEHSLPTSRFATVLKITSPHLCSHSQSGMCQSDSGIDANSDTSNCIPLFEKVKIPKDEETISVSEAYAPPNTKPPVHYNLGAALPQPYTIPSFIPVAAPTPLMGGGFIPTDMHSMNNMNYSEYHCEPNIHNSGFPLPSNSEYMSLVNPFVMWNNMNPQMMSQIPANVIQAMIQKQFYESNVAPMMANNPTALSSSVIPPNGSSIPISQHNSYYPNEFHNYGMNYFPPGPMTIHPQDSEPVSNIPHENGLYFVYPSQQPLLSSSFSQGVHYPQSSTINKINYNPRADYCPTLSKSQLVHRHDDHSLLNGHAGVEYSPIFSAQPQIPYPASCGPYIGAGAHPLMTHYPAISAFMPQILPSNLLNN